MHVMSLGSKADEALMFSRRVFLAGLACAAYAPFAHAQEEPMYFSADGAAISGYDAVSYFNGGQPLQGAADIAVMWKGAIWHFASQENRDQFERNPRAYAPQFGGYCALAMAQGSLSSTDPKAWKIVDGRLYLTHSPAIEKIWEKNVVEYIHLAEQHWPVILYE
ncbi:MAG: YHS domain-containing (seleno)protein [Ruegeria sp.]